MANSKSEFPVRGTDERRLTRKGKATRDHIVAVAADLMFDRGVAGTTMPDVMSAAGVGASQLYHYFGDKKGLVRAVIADQTERTLDHQRPMIDRLDSMEALQAWRDQLVMLQQSIDRKGCGIGSLASELTETDPDLREDLVAAFGRWEGLIRDGLRQMRDRGDLNEAADPDRLAVTLLSALQGAMLLTQVRRDTAALETVLDSAIDYVRSFTRVPA